MSMRETQSGDFLAHQGKRFRLAPMSGPIRLMTAYLLLLPLLFLVCAWFFLSSLALVALLLAALYAWVWVRFRPTEFVIGSDRLEIRWPLKHRSIPQSSIAKVQVINAHQLRQEMGWALRIGAGGLWGGFGWLWTKNRGLVQMYVSRTEDLVLIERTIDRPLLTTPEQGETFVDNLRASIKALG